MNEEIENSLKSAPATVLPDGSSLINEARTLFDRLAGEVAQCTERDRTEAMERGSVAKMLLTACFVTGLTQA